MKFNRKLWKEAFPSQYDVPALPCPRCRDGNLHQIPGSFRELPTERQNLEDQVKRPLFMMGYGCVQCFEHVAVIGNSRHESPSLVPKAIYPAPPIIEFPAKTPPEVIRELKISFGLFWNDLGSCANKLRVSVERVLDHFGSSGRTLYERIGEFQKTYPEQAAIFDALRQVGNVGSHSGDNSRATILDAFEVYEYALFELFGSHREYFNSLRKKIVARKGK
jgi:hypothetical protein